MIDILQIVRQTARDFAETQLALPVDQGGLDSFDLLERWPFIASTLARDVYYYSNGDLEDRIVFGVNSFSIDKNGRCKIATSLFRESDRQLIANIFTVKEVHE